MKKNLGTLHLTGTNNRRTEGGSFITPNNKILYAEAPDNLRWPALLNAFAGIIAPVKRIKGNETAPTPSFNVLIKEAAARLSDIEMAIFNYDLFILQFSIHTLKSLFFNMPMPTAFRMMEQMEELAKENQLRQVNDLFLKLKIIIGQLVGYNREIKDC